MSMPCSACIATQDAGDGDGSVGKLPGIDPVQFEEIFAGFNLGFFDDLQQQRAVEFSPASLSWAMRTIFSSSICVPSKTTGCALPVK
jgi:hypothetical protein